MSRKIFLPSRPLSRRGFLQAGGIALAVTTVPRWAGAGAPVVLEDNAFTLGVGSGYPTPGAVILWTRLAPLPLAPHGGMPPLTVPVSWEVATDERFGRVVRSGTEYAAPDWAHSVHVEVGGLEPDRPYWYRFTAMGQQSPVGKTWTAPAPDSKRDALRIAVVSCQNYEHGYFTAYRQIASESPDLIVHVGDYIYEGANGPNPVRRHERGEAYTLEDYRIRHALYRLDPDLQAAHAAAPWLLTWDDHEIDNDYAGDVSEQDDDPELFRQRRAAAMRAYYEHLPLPRSAVPFGSTMRLYQQRNFGSLASLYTLDGRQFRSPHACGAPGKRGSRRVQECAEVLARERTMLGELQEAWIAARLEAAGAKWNLLAQGVMLSYLDEQEGPGQQFWTDSWNGYHPARERLLDALAQPKVSNPVVLTGDIHAFLVGQVHRHPGRADSPFVASELVTTSISSRGPPEEMIQSLASINPNIAFGTAQHRGYARLDVRATELRADLVSVDALQATNAAAKVIRSFVIESGQPLKPA